MLLYVIVPIRQFFTYQNERKMSETIDFGPKKVEIQRAVVGDTLTFPVGKVTYKDTNGVKQPYDLTGATARIRIRSSTSDIVYESTSFSMGADGSYSHVASDETTDDIPEGRSSYSVKFFFANGTERTVFVGPINFVKVD